MTKFISSYLSAALVLSTAAVALEPATMTSATAAHHAPVVETPLGKLRGEKVENNGVSATIFRGVPYAQAPAGEYRFRAPRPALPWEGVRDATEWADRCPQGSSNMGTLGPISEDCLYLNITTNAAGTDKKLPVMVFYHGGGLTSGTGNSTTYNHPMLANKDVVLVTANSRLGPIGYLAHPALTEEGELGIGNYGTLDLKASLEWVRDNISAFGGDPENVTIFGESGGGAKVMSQMSTPLAADLFHKAIVQSGSSLESPARRTTLEDAEKRGEALVEELGLSDEEDIAAALRALPWEDIIAAGAKTAFRPGVAVDGTVIPEPIDEMFVNGTYNKVPLIVGANEGEKYLLEESVPSLANTHSGHGAATYIYNFTQLPAGWRDEEGCVAFHGLELSYVFGAIPEGLKSRTTQYLAGRGGCSVRVPEHDEQDLTVAEQSAEIWAQFAKTGDPSIEGLVDWPAYTEEDNYYLDLAAGYEVKRGIEDSYVAPVLKD